jgi:hypothetical protein
MYLQIQEPAAELLTMSKPQHPSQRLAPPELAYFEAAGLTPYSLRQKWRAENPATNSQLELRIALQLMSGCFAKIWISWDLLHPFPLVIQDAGQPERLIKPLIFLIF